MIRLIDLSSVQPSHVHYYEWKLSVLSCSQVTRVKVCQVQRAKDTSMIRPLNLTHSNSSS